MGYWDMYTSNNLNLGYNNYSNNAMQNFFAGFMHSPIASFLMAMNNPEMSSETNFNFANPMFNYNPSFNMGSVFNTFQPTFNNFGTTSIFNNGFSYPTIPTFPTTTTTTTSSGSSSGSREYSLSGSFGSSYRFGDLITAPKRTTSTSSSSSSRTSSSSSTGYRTDFASMTQTQATRAAEASPHLERLDEVGNGWKLGNTFENDIKYAAKGMNNFLDHLASKISKDLPSGTDLTVTSALGTASSPHSKNAGHYDPVNPKLDFGGRMTNDEAEHLASSLQSTGYFSHILVEPHGDGYAHVDVRVKESVLDRFA